ncbi:YTH domain-containing protein, partial [Phlyctochytrium arcticum]
ARYFVIKSHTPSNIHLSLRHSTWSSTPYGHRRLHQAYTSTHPSPIYLFFSANGSGRFCGVAIMSSGVVEDGPRRMQWDGGEWQGGFSARWIYVKDVLNGSVKDLRVPANENKSVAQSRDTQELPAEVGSSLLDLFASMLFSSSMLSD